MVCRYGREKTAKLRCLWKTSKGLRQLPSEAAPTILTKGAARELETSFDDKPENFAAIRPEGDSHAQFVGALGNRRGHDAKEADAGEAEPQHRQSSLEVGQPAIVAEPGVDLSFMVRML